MKKGLVVGLSYLAVIAWGCLPMLSNQVSIAIAASKSLVAVAQTSRQSLQQPPIQKQSDSLSESPRRRTPIQSTKRLKIEIDVTSPGDLLVKEGQTVTANQLIADRK